MCFFRALSNLDALFTHTTVFFDEKKTNYCDFRYPAFAGLPSLHCGGLTVFPHLLRCSGYLSLPRNCSTWSTSIPFRCSDYMTTPTTPATSALDLWVDGFAWFFMLCHHCPTDGPSSLDISLTLKSQKCHLAVVKNIAKSHRKRYKSQELNNANSDKLRSPKSVENWVSYSSPKFRGQMQKNGA